MISRPCKFHYAREENVLSDAPSLRRRRRFSLSLERSAVRSSKGTGIIHGQAAPRKQAYTMRAGDHDRLLTQHQVEGSVHGAKARTTLALIRPPPAVITAFPSSDSFDRDAIEICARQLNVPTYAMPPTLFQHPSSRLQLQSVMSTCR